MSSIWVKSQIPVFEGEIIVAQMDVKVYPMKDLGLKDGIADDVEFEGLDGRWYSFPDKRDPEILKLIERYDPEAYNEILCRREVNALASSKAA